MAKRIALLVGLIVWSIVGSARAQPRSLQVLSLMSDDAVAQAHAFGGALRHAIESDSALKLGAGEYALEVLLVALKCPEEPDVACLKRIAKKIGTPEFMWGKVKLEGNAAVVELRFFSFDHERRTEARFSKDLMDADDEILVSIAARAKDRLLQTDADEGATPAIETEDNDSEEEAGTEPPPPVPATLPGSPPAARETTPVAGWIILGSGIALLGGGLYSALRVDGMNHDAGLERYRRGLPKSADACDSADAGKAVEGAPAPSDISDHCSTAHRFQVLQYVFLGVGALASAAGTYLIVTHDSGKKQGAVRPRFDVGRNRAELGLDVTF